MPEHEEITWHVTTHEHKERTTDWYWALGLLTLVGVAVSIYFSNVLLAIILGVGGTFIGVLVIRGPREHTVKIDKRGIAMDGTLYPYSAIHSFWVEEDADTPRLFLLTSSLLAPHITIPLDDVSHGAQVRTFLKKRLEEVEQQPRFGEHVAELLGL